MKPARPTSTPTSSYYHNSTGSQSPHTQHFVGIGNAGIGLARGFFRVGETEDMLADPRARFSMLVIDIEDAEKESGSQMEPFREEKVEFLERLDERGIPRDRASIQAISLEVPSKEDVEETLTNYRKYLMKEYPVLGDDPDHESWLPDDLETLVELTDSEGRHPIGVTDQLEDMKDVHVPRAVAKAIYGFHYYNTGELQDALDEFAESVQATDLPALVFVGFGVGGGTGSGMVVDLARHLTTERLGREQPVIGLGVLPNRDDPERFRGANLFTTMNELDALVDKSKNEGIVDVWGELYRNPFTGGLLLIPTEHVIDRVGYYTEDTKDFAGHWLKQGRKFIADTTAKYITRDQGRYFYNAMKSGPQSELAAPHEKRAKFERSFDVMDICKFAHPGVQMIPGDYNTEYREDYRRSIDMIREKLGFPAGFKTNYIDVSVAAPRWVWTEGLTQELIDELAPWVENGADDMTIDVREAFDTLTAYAVILFAGAAKTDFPFYADAREAYDQLSDEEKVLNHSLLLEVGSVLSEPSSVEGYAGKSLWGTGGMVNIPHDAVRGDAEIRDSVIAIMKEQAEGVVRATTSTAGDD
jgi:hypothetical protein